MQKLNRLEGLAYLAENPEENCAYINFIENNPVSQFYRSGESILFRGTSDRDWVYIRSDNERELQDLAVVLTDRDQNYALVQEWMLPLLSRGREPSWQMTSLKFQMPSGASLPEPKTAPVRLLPEHAEKIYSLWPYAGVTTLDYTRDRIARGHSAAVFQNGEPAAWAITHDDGAIGFLFVRPEYRGRGYGQDVTLAIARELRQLNKPAFVHIEPDNPKSLALAGKLGFVEKGLVKWVGY